MATRKRTRKSKKWISRLFFLLLLVATCVLCYFVWDAYFKDKGTKPEETKPEEKTIDVKPEEKKEEEKTETPEEKPKVPQYDGGDPNTAPGLTGAITYVGITGGYLRIRVNIDQYLANGSCNVVLTRGGTQIFSDYANIVSSASTSTCEGFDIPTASLGSGSTSIKVTFSSGDRSGTASGETTL